MIITYNPQLENPPREKEVTLGFSFIGTKAASTEHVYLKSGVNRDIDAKTWEKLKEKSLVQDLLKLGAITVQEDIEVVEVAPKATGGLSNLPVKEAVSAINASFDIDLLKEWDAAEARVRIKNTIAKRIQAITEGEG